MEYILYERINRIAYITFNRPDKRNAFNDGVVSELREAFERAEKDELVKVIILRSNGAVFSAGADLGYLQSLKNFSFEENLADSTTLMELYKYIYTHPKVVIAQIQGHAIAGGCGLATICDFSFSVPNAQFGYTEVKIGFIPAIVMVFLLRKIGEGRAKELLLTGKLISAQIAQQYGIINELVPADTLESYVFDFAEKLCEEASGQSLQSTKAMIAAVQEMPLNDALSYAAHQNASSRMSNDCQSGMSKFLNKEKISWK